MNNHKNNSDFSIFEEIVDQTPIELIDFFNQLIESQHTPQSAIKIDALNAIIRNEKDRKKALLLFQWLEIFRDIFILYSLKNEKKGTKNNKPLFTTYSLTFEHPSLTPDYWFFNEQLIGNDIQSSAKAILLSFERYMYDTDGGGCWGALEWEIDKYCFRCVCEPMRKKGEEPLYKIATLLLTAQAIINGKMGLYISSREDIDLPYLGIQRGKNTKSTLLKYYHYDRFTKLSSIRERELSLDAGKQVELPCYETDWQSAAALTEFSLMNKNARATKTTCTRVMLEEFLLCLRELARPMALGKRKECVNAIEKIQQAFDDENYSFAKLSKSDLLHLISEKRIVSHENLYLIKSQINNAITFWQNMKSIFDYITKNIKI